MTRYPESEAGCRDRLRRAIRWNTRGWLALVLCIAMLVLFEDPRDWGEGRVATVLLWLGRIGIGPTILALIISSRRVGRLEGYAVGQFSKQPAELLGAPVDSRDR